MENLDGFYVIWLDSKGEEIAEEWIFKHTYEQALRSTALRIRQSSHLCPVDTGGFYIESAFDYRKRKGLPLSGLTPTSVDEISQIVEERYGPPPDQET